MAANSFYVRVPIYKDVIFVLVGKNKKEITKLCWKHHKNYSSAKEDGGFTESVLNNMGTSAAFTLEGNEGCPHIVWFSKKDVGYLVHELVHLCSLIFKNVRMKHTPETDEAYAYLLEYLYNEIKNKW